jgi:hypothetical protein
MSEERTKLNQVNGSVVLFHGSPVVIDDNSMASGSWFTDDIEIAQDYGDVVYRLDLPPDKMGIMSKSFEGHYVSHGHIPMGYFDILVFDSLRYSGGSVSQT